MSKYARHDLVNFYYFPLAVKYDAYEGHDLRLKLMKQKNVAIKIYRFLGILISAVPYS